MASYKNIKELTWEVDRLNILETQCNHVNRMISLHNLQLLLIQSSKARI
jgi:hypothetical protein